MVDRLQRALSTRLSFRWSKKPTFLAKTLQADAETDYERNLHEPEDDFEEGQSKHEKHSRSKSLGKSKHKFKHSENQDHNQKDKTDRTSSFGNSEPPHLELAYSSTTTSNPPQSTHIGTSNE